MTDWKTTEDSIQLIREVKATRLIGEDDKKVEVIFAKDVIQLSKFSKSHWVILNSNPKCQVTLKRKLKEVLG